MPSILTLNDCLEDYYAEARGSFSASTWSAHEGQLERMREWVTTATQPYVYLADVDTRLMTKYFARLRPPRYAESTFNNYRQYVRAFFEYAREEGWITVNPMRHVDALRVPERIRLQLSAWELLKMLEGAGPRDRVALAIGMNTALRGGDIATLKIGDVNLTNDTLSAWVEKIDTEVQLPITAELRAELITWFGVYAESMGLASIHDLPNEWTLVPPAQGVALRVNSPEAGTRVILKPMKKYTHPEKIVQRGLERLGHPTAKEGFHTLRRSAAREVYELAVERKVGDPIRIAQALLGHKNQKTTERYLGITHEIRLRDEMMRGQSFLTARLPAPPAEIVDLEERRHA